MKTLRSREASGEGKRWYGHFKASPSPADSFLAQIGHTGALRWGVGRTYAQDTVWMRLGNRSSRGEGFSGKAHKWGSPEICCTKLPFPVPHRAG